MKKSLLTILLSSLLVFAVKSYTVNTCGFVRDNATGLLWTRCSVTENGPDKSPYCTGSPGQFSWIEAIGSCEELSLASRTDWRLPSVRELQSIVTYYHEAEKTPKINSDAFPNTVSGKYWSSTTTAKDENLAWVIDFQYAQVLYYYKINSEEEVQKLYVRCVAGPDR